jgi:alkaline phosphatase
LKNIGQKIISFALIGSLTAGSFAFAAREEAKQEKKQKPIKNVIMMVRMGQASELRH